MALRAIFGRRWVGGLGLVAAAAAGYVFGLASDRLAAQAPALQKPTANKSWVATIYGNVPVTREELGEFLIARGGYEKVDLLVNKKIIEVEAARRQIAVTDVEVRAGLEGDLRGLDMKMDDFVKRVLPRYNKSLYEWTEDVIKPRILLSKMCRANVKVTEEDLKRLFENKYGERRQAKIICWPANELKIAQAKWAEARKGDVEFDSVARMQGDPNLAAAAGLTAPVGRNAYDDTEGKEASVEKVLFNLKEGEMSQLFQLPAGIMCVKCVKIIPPDSTVSMEKVKATLEKEVFDKKLNAEIPKFFNALKKQADPQVYLKGPPTAREFQEGTNQIIQSSGITPPMNPLPIPTPTPMPKMP
jgi:hypothetical protein